jgi:5-methylcytosine-specific restriction protein A
MPSKPLHPCNKPGCSRLTKNRFCETHEALYKKQSQEYDRERDKTEERQWIHSQRWRDARNTFLTEHPLCMECLKKGKDEAAYLVDHIVPHQGNYDLFWDESNWQSLCNPCHEEKHKGERWGGGSKSLQRVEN